MRWIRLFFAWCFAPLAAFFFWMDAQILWQMFGPSRAVQANNSFGFLFPAVTTFMAVVFALAWWKTIRNLPTARGWGIASGCNLAGMGISVLANNGMRSSGKDFFFYWILLGAGIVAILAFALTRAPGATAANSKRLHQSGDGTSKVLDILFTSFAVVVAYWLTSQWSNWGDRHNLPSPSTFPFLLETVLSIAMSLFIHEAGHALAGHFQRMKLIRFTIGPINFQIFDQQKWKFQFRINGAKTFMGATQVVPLDMVNFRQRKIIQVAAGPVASLMAGTIAWLLLLVTPGRVWQSHWLVLANFMVISLVLGVFNMAPFAIGSSGFSDGAKIYQLLKGGSWADHQEIQAMIYAMDHTALRPRDLDLEKVCNAASVLPQGMGAAYTHLLRYAYYLDRQNLDQAREEILEAARLSEPIEAKLSVTWLSSLVFGVAFLGQDADQAHRWWNRLSADKDFRLEGAHLTAHAALLWREGKNMEAMDNLQRAEAWADTLPDRGNNQAERNALNLLRSALKNAAPEFATMSTP